MGASQCLSLAARFVFHSVANEAFSLADMRGNVTPPDGLKVHPGNFCPSEMITFSTACHSLLN